jgi:enoyl-CoA hydratase
MKGGYNMVYGNALTFRKEENIGIITLNKPESFNLVGAEFLYELDEIQNDIEKDESIQGLLIHALGEHFSAGIDFNTLQEFDSSTAVKKLTWLQRIYGRWQEWPFVVIVAMQGMCLGSAAELSLGCDIRIASDDVRISMPEVRFNVAPDMGGTCRLTRLVGTGQAKRMLLLCEEINAQEALRIGFVEKVVPKDKLYETAFKLTRRAAALPPAGINFAKKGINMAAESSVYAALMFEQAQSCYCMNTEDKKEGIASFFEKRKPVYKGK